MIDLLSDSVFEDLEVILSQVPAQRSGGVPNRKAHADQANVHSNRGVLRKQEGQAKHAEDPR